MNIKKPTSHTNKSNNVIELTYDMVVKLTSPNHENDAQGTFGGICRPSNDAEQAWTTPPTARELGQALVKANRLGLQVRRCSPISKWEKTGLGVPRGFKG